MSTFKNRCNKAAKEAGVDVYFYDDPIATTKAFEDAGSLHATVVGIHACFQIGKYVRASEHNAKVKLILNRLRMSRYTSDCLLDEDDDDFCPHCGERLN